MPTKTLRIKAKTNNKKLKFGKSSFWKRKSTLIITAVIIAIGAGVILKSFAATPVPTGVVAIDMSSGIPSEKWVAALQGFGVANVTRVACGGTGTGSGIHCLAAPWTSLGPALRNINIETVGNDQTGAIVGGTGTDSQYYYRTKACFADSCPWSGFVSAGGNTSSLQTVLLGYSTKCDTVFAIGTDHNLYHRELCLDHSGGSSWYAVPGATNVTKIFKINTDDGSLGVINSSNSVSIYGRTTVTSPSTISGPSAILSNGAYYTGSDVPITNFTSTATNNILKNHFVAVGTDNRLYTSSATTTGGASWSLAFNNTTLVTDIFASSDANEDGGAQYVVRTSTGITYLVAPDATYGETKSASVRSLGGNCGQMRASDGIVVCIGSDKNVYYRSFNVNDLGTDNIGWRTL